MDEFPHICYRDHPHFTVGHVDQWGESGYLYFEGMVYSYEEDRKCQYGRTHTPMKPDDFLSYARRNGVEVPTSFLECIGREN